MLATPARALPRGDGWLHEPLLDGFRAIVDVRAGAARLRSRRGLDVTRRFRSLAEAIPASVRLTSGVLDGYVCALDGGGIPRFELLRAADARLVLYLHDVLEVDGAPVIDLPLRDRIDLLVDLVAVAGGPVRRALDFDDGDGLLRATRAHGLAGVVSRRTSSPYRPGQRSALWKVVEHPRRRVFAVVGESRARVTLAALDEAGNEVVVGHARRPEDADGFPASACLVEFDGWTAHEQLRAPRIVAVERGPVTLLPSSAETLVEVPNAGKELFGGLTRGRLLRFYEGLAPAIVPHLRDRAFVVRFGARPGVHGTVLKDVPAGSPDWLPRAELPAASRGGQPVVAPVVCAPSDLLWLVARGVIELHATLHRVDEPDRPDVVLFDLDPTSGAGPAEAATVALTLRDALAGIGLAAVVKTSGGRGLHVAVPIERGPTYAETRAFARTVAEAVSEELPSVASARFGDRTPGRVVVDWRQNHTGASIAAPYSVRAVEGAPVSCPVSWDELERGVDPAAFTLEAVCRRVEEFGDLYADVLEAGQQLRLPAGLTS